MRILLHCCQSFLLKHSPLVSEQPSCRPGIWDHSGKNSGEVDGFDSGKLAPHILTNPAEREIVKEKTFFTINSSYSFFLPHLNNESYSRKEKNPNFNIICEADTIICVAKIKKSGIKRWRSLFNTINGGEQSWNPRALKPHILHTAVIPFLNYTEISALLQLGQC